MPIVTNLLVYPIEVRWQLMWFPIQGKAPIDTYMTKVGDFRHKNTEDTFEIGSINYILDFAGRTKVSVGGQIDVRIDEDAIFYLKVWAYLGMGAGTGKDEEVIFAPPNVRTHFMLNATGPENERDVRGTAMSLHGTIKTGKRPAEILGRFSPIPAWGG